LQPLEVDPHSHTVVQLYLPGGADVHHHLIHCFLGQSHSPPKMASQFLQPFLHGQCHILPMCYTPLPHYSPKLVPSHVGFWTLIKYTIPWVHQTQGHPRDSHKSDEKLFDTPTHNRSTLKSSASSKLMTICQNS